METTFICAILKRDGDKDILIDENDKIETKNKERMIPLYTDYAMVNNFLINLLISIYVSTNIMLL
jgi:hypothetical protein